MLYGIVIILILLGVSGAIAYMGDWLGTKIGKKKVSIFGLRPKHTSIVITIATGIMITAFTLGVILLISTSAREALFSLNQIKTEYKRTKIYLERKTGEYNAVQKKLKRIEKEYAERESVLREDLRSRQEELDRLTGEINAKTLELRRLKVSNEKLKSDVTKLQGQRTELEKERKALAVKIQELEKTRRELTAKKESLEKEITRMASQRFNDQKVGLYGDILYQRNQPIARFYVERDISRAELEQNITESFDVLNKTAKEKGAAIASDSLMFEKMQIDKVWNALSQSGEGLVVEAVSATNVFKKDEKGEPFYAELKTYENKLVFNTGDVIASASVPAGSDEDAVNKIMSKAISQAVAMARSRGILPDLQTYMDSISFPRLPQAASALAGGKRDVEVQLFSSRDTRVADKLLVDYRIK